MTKSETIADPTSCLNRAAADEPVFVLRANDPLAAGIVEEWADRYMRAHPWTRAAVAKNENALQVAQRMRTWALRNVKP